MKRIRSDYLDTIINREFKILDHGFIKVVDYMGNDDSICHSARLSYGKGTKSVSDNTGLIRYLIRHSHTSPLEMCEIKFHVKMPIFVARQWIRHRTANVNEYSGRYSILDKEFYIPDQEHMTLQSETNNQGRNDVTYTDRKYEKISQSIENGFKTQYEKYEHLLENGLARELSRMVLPVNAYTQMIWKIDLHNLLHFLKLRADSHAQYEIRVYAEKMLEIVEGWVPIAYKAFMDYKLNAQMFSEKEIKILRKMLKDYPEFSTKFRNRIEGHYTYAGMTKREATEMLDKLEI